MSYPHFLYSHPYLQMLYPYPHITGYPIVIGTVSSLDTHKASSPFSIPSQILPLVKQCIYIPHFLKSLIYLLPLVSSQPTVKIAKVIPVHKKGSTLELSIYRPISLLSNIGKVFEKLIYKHVYELFLNRIKVIYNEQYGFRKGYSTSQTLLNITQKIMDALDKGKFACGVFIDLQKAFDTIDHDILLKKLYHYGIRSTPLSLFPLLPLWKKTICFSCWFKIFRYDYQTWCTTRLSPWSPSFSTLYKDLHCAMKFSLVHHFADDTNILHKNDSPKQLAKHINLDPKFLCNWLNANKISLNKGKTEYVIFKGPQETLHYADKYVNHLHKDNNIYTII